jgi:hypothetical protein
VDCLVLEAKPEISRMRIGGSGADRADSRAVIGIIEDKCRGLVVGAVSGPGIEKQREGLASITDVIDSLQY